MTRLLVTGAAGFVGRQALARLAGRGYEIHATSSSGRSVPGADVWHRVDLLGSDVGPLLREVRPELLLHLAWYAVPGRYWTAKENLDWLRAGLALLRAFRDAGGRRAVVAGSSAEYDWGSGLCVEERTPLAPATLYGAAKASLFSVGSAFAKQEGLRLAWGRIFFLYGPHEAPERLVSGVTRALLAGRPAPCTRGEQLRDFLHVADAAGALVALLESEVDGPVNVASGEAVSVRSVVDRIAAIVGRADLLRPGAIEPAPGDPPRLLASTARLRDEVGWRPLHDLDSGLRDTIAWWTSQPPD